MSKQKPVLLRSAPEMTIEELAEGVKRILARNGITVRKDSKSNDHKKKKGSNESIR